MAAKKKAIKKATPKPPKVLGVVHGDKDGTGPLWLRIDLGDGRVVRVPASVE